jgi:hypothetical protein
MTAFIEEYSLPGDVRSHVNVPAGTERLLRYGAVTTQTVQPPPPFRVSA